MSALQRVMYNHMQTSGILLTEDKVRCQIDHFIIILFFSFRTAKEVIQKR